jgi:hypothetical protein
VVVRVHGPMNQKYELLLLMEPNLKPLKKIPFEKKIKKL